MIQARFSFVARRVHFTAAVGLFLLSLVLLSIPLTSAQAGVFGTISGTVFSDLNINTVLDPNEQSLAGWQVNLYQGTKLIASQSTDNSGNYYFANLAAGDYQIKLTILNKWEPVSPADVYLNLSVGESKKIDFANYQVAADKAGYSPMMSIHTISLVALSPTSVKIIWFTNYAATSQIIFGQDSKTAAQLSIADNNFSYPLSSAVDFKTGTYHSVTLTDLKPQTAYHYRVSSLSDPRQWRGALRLISNEFSFNTGGLSPANSNPAVKTSPGGAEERKGKILAIDYQEPLPNNAPTTTGANEAINNIISGLPAQCPVYIWILLGLNLIMTILVWSRNKNSQNLTDKKFWWIILILVLVPVILAYPECWLSGWLAIMAIITLIYLALSLKKAKPKSAVPLISPDSFFTAGPKNLEKPQPDQAIKPERETEPPLPDTEYPPPINDDQSPPW
jgi:hypothetical protein